jgi:hypothetical protein
VISLPAIGKPKPGAEGVLWPFVTVPHEVPVHGKILGMGNHAGGGR